MSTSQPSQPSQLNKADRMRGALWGMFVGDALAMPVHWYYSISTLWQDFGQIRDYQIIVVMTGLSAGLAKAGKIWFS